MKHRAPSGTLGDQRVKPMSDLTASLFLTAVALAVAGLFVGVRVVLL